MKHHLLFLFAFFSCQICRGQAGALDLSFDPGTGANYEIKAIAIQNDGKILIGGFFTSYDGTPSNYIARLNSNGSLDNSFQTGTGADSLIYAITIQSDEKILIGGNFKNFNGIPNNKLVRLHPDGSIDTSFNIGTGIGGSGVKAITVQPDGKILVSGNFTSINGISFPNFFRLHANGSLDNSFNTSGGTNGSVECMAIQSDGEILIGGSFTSYGGLPPLRIARIKTNGALDLTFNNAIGGAGSTVRAIDLTLNEKIILGGDFTGYNLVSMNYLVRIVPIGAIDNSFENGQSANSPVYAIEVMSNDNILIAGNFTAYDGAPATRIARLLKEGYIDTTFNTGSGADAAIHALAVQSDGKVLIAGAFTSFDGISRNCVARLYNCNISQPGAISGNDSTLCTQTLVYSVPPLTDADSYEWTLPAGWTGTSNSNSITVVSNGQGGVISVRAFNDSCGYSDWQTKTVYRIAPPEIPLCRVTVNLASTHNIVTWEDPADKSLIDSFYIYRETLTNVYSKIGAVHRDSLSEYHDLDANPNSTSYRYKLSVLDVCGVESEKSPDHNTIHLQYLGFGNFLWTFYKIDNSINPVTSFNVYRDDLGNGSFSLIGLIPGTNATFTDINESAFPDARYLVDVNWDVDCIAPLEVNTTRSNIRRKTDPVSVNMNASQESGLRVFYHAAEGNITFSVSDPVNVEGATLLNSLGQTIWSEKSFRLSAADNKAIPAEAFTTGIYFLVLETKTGVIKRKVIIQQ